MKGRRRRGLAAGDAASREALAPRRCTVRRALPTSSQTCRTETIVPTRGPGEATGCGLGARWALSVAWSARIYAARTKMPRARDPGVLGAFRAGGLRALGRWAVVLPGAGPWVIRSCWALRKADLPWSRLDRECWWKWSCVTALAELINKSRLCCGVSCGKPVRD